MTSLDENCFGCLYVMPKANACSMFMHRYTLRCPCKTCVVKVRCTQQCDEFLELEEEDMNHCIGLDGDQRHGTDTEC